MAVIAVSDTQQKTLNRVSGSRIVWSAPSYVSCDFFCRGQKEFCWENIDSTSRPIAISLALYKASRSLSKWQVNERLSQNIKAAYETSSVSCCKHLLATSHRKIASFHTTSPDVRLRTTNECSSPGFYMNGWIASIQLSLSLSKNFNMRSTRFLIQCDGTSER